jgi:hypothetical protein
VGGAHRFPHDCAYVVPGPCASWRIARPGRCTQCKRLTLVTS